MSTPSTDTSEPSCIVTFYHDVEQNIDSEADPERCRNMVRAFLELEDKYDMSVTYNLVGKLYNEQPDMVDWIVDAGQEIAFHSYNHHPDWNRSYYSEEVELCRNVSDSIRGYRSPRSQWDNNTIHALADNQFLWNAESDKSPEPYFIHGRVVRLPIAGDDWPLHTGTLSVHDWLIRFDKLISNRPYVAVGMHDLVASIKPEEMLSAWESLLQIALRNNAHSANFSESCDLFRRTSLAQYYSKNAERWNHATRTLYRTKRFRELIRAEAEKRPRPAIVDLGSGGGVLTAGLADLASTIYCVDSAPGMVADVAANAIVKPYLGEVTESGLPDNCADLVVCARVIEYLYWPERLADEIKRVAKTGATYFVTFPAFRGVTAMPGSAPPDRIRHYFTPDQIHQWASSIGPGTLFGVQYDEAEPKNSEDEHAQRALEKTQPGDSIPTNYVFIGTVDATETTNSTRKTIPISAARFTLR